MLTLALVAHADDNAIALGGAEAMIASIGGRIKSVVATDQGERKLEELRSNHILGIEHTIFLPFEDGEFDGQNDPGFIKKVAWLIQEKVPDLSNVQNIITFDEQGYTSHPDHVTAHLVANEIFITHKNIEFITYRSMKNYERSMWMPYFIPIQPQDHIPAVELDTRMVAGTVNDAIRAHKSQYEIDGKKHEARRRLLMHRERYRVVRKGGEMYGK